MPGDWTRVAVTPRVAGPAAGWLRLRGRRRGGRKFVPDGPTLASDPLLLYFTSGTTAQPKLVEHTHASYPVGHLSTMYWIGLQPGDVHLNISSPGWAKHAWSNVFAPWNAGATVLLSATTGSRRRPAGRDRRAAGDHVLRAAHRVADADPGRPGRADVTSLREMRRPPASRSTPR